MRCLNRRVAIAGIASSMALPALARATVSPLRDWPTMAPGDAGFDQRRLADAANQLGSAGERQGLVIVHDGHLIFERYWANEYHRAEPTWRNVSFSSGKSWGATMVGRAVTKGHLKVDDLARRYVDPQRTGLHRDTTIRHLLAMTSGGSLVTKPSSRPPSKLGYERPTGPAAEYRRSSGESEEPNAPKGYGVSIPPGTQFFYDGAAADHLAEIVSAATGSRSHDFMMREVVEPLGCRNFSYQPEGIDGNGDVRIGGSILVSCRDMAKLGQLYMNGGRWNGRQLIASDFINEAISPSPHNPDYGFLWWLNTSGRVQNAPQSMYFAAGARGQFCFVVPDRKLVIATMGFGKEQLSASKAWDALSSII